MTLNKLKIKLTVVVTFLMQLFAISYAGNAIDFSSPENTVKTYYEHYFDKDVVVKCFYPEQYFNKKDKWWLDYKILKVEKSKKIGEKTHSNIVINRDAKEIVVEVTMNHSQKGNPKTKFWYLLQKVSDEWKIIEHSHIADKNYPTYD